ncbi:MAG TPA: SIMPL domain-containing protein [Pyrinomonadaceae bacterium]|jgi:hypothetical protein
MKKQLLIFTTLLVLLAGFGARAFAAEITVRGRLARTVEAGGWLIQTSEQKKYLILNFQRFQNEKWFAEGAQVEAVGDERPGTITIYQEGIPFEVRSMRPFAGDGSGASGTAAQITSPLPTRVLVTGDSLVRAQPDTAIVVLSVFTQAKTAVEAQQQNATLTDAVLRAVKAAAGTGAEVKTSGYSLQPQRLYKENQPPTITGYEARNMITVTMSDLTRVGAVIDAGGAAGANNVESLSFTLRQDRAARNQALTEATREALNKAQTIAQAVGGRVTRILEVQEASATVRPIYQSERSVGFNADARTQTPIEPGTLDINAQVQVIVEVETLK